MNRNQWVGVISISAVLLLSLSGLVLYRESKTKQSRVEQRFPLQALGYCTSSPVKPCVLSFGLDVDGNMLVNFLTEGAFYPDFYLKIKTDTEEYLYVCEKTSTFATSVYCSGKALPLGQTFQFLILSLNEDVLLAQGNFPIIGVALVTPVDYASPTPPVTPTSVFTREVTPSPSYPSYPGTRP